ncbi:MAG: hypothetical protein BGO95_06620 [Micrococcales bacterium 73-13]|nr:MAG: hypothetical protein BGO95_06620 [Micrococcales bacterium 73-13]
MHSNRPRLRARLGVAAAASAALVASAVLLVAAPAAAHVHVDGDARPGERATLSFRVPTESDTASTTSLTITLPTDVPITSARPQAKAGWTTEVTRVRLDEPVVVGDVAIASAIGSITWTATGDGIAPDEFDDFVVQLGPIPDAAELVLPATQGYSDGTVVEWSDPPADGAEPEHPAPVLAIGAAAPAGEQGTAGLAIAGLVVGAVGLAAGLIAIVVAAGAVRRARRG